MPYPLGMAEESTSEPGARKAAASSASKTSASKTSAASPAPKEQASASPRKRTAAKRSVAKTSAAKASAAKRGTAEAGASKASAAKRGSVKAGVSKTGATKTTATKTGTSKTGAAKAGAAKAGAAKTSTAKTSAAKAGAARTGTAKASAARTSAAKAGATKAGAATSSVATGIEKPTPATKSRTRASKARPQVLPPKPRLPRSGKRVLDGVGTPVFGARHGAVDLVDWSALADEHRPSPINTALRRRRWIYATAATERHLIVVAVVDAGVSGTAFCMVTDLVTGEQVVDSSRPGALRPLFHVGDQPLAGLTATYRLPGTDYRISTEPGRNEIRIQVRLRRTSQSLPGLRYLPGIKRIPIARDLPTASSQPWVEVDFTLEPTVAPALTAVTPVSAHGGLVTSTTKTAAMNAWGTVTVHGEVPDSAPRTISLDGGTGGMDYTNGFLPRHTHWRWAYSTGRLSDGRLFGLNLVSDFSGIGDNSCENAVWLDGALVPLDPRVRVQYDPDDLHQPWTVRALDGSVDLRFEPLAVHDEGLNLGVLRSKFIQPTGHYTGHVTVEGERIEIDRMPGVIENQDVIW